jgi:hypothetical protein
MAMGVVTGLFGIGLYGHEYGHEVDAHALEI